MMTKKCAVSFIICSISLLLVFAAMHFMSLWTVSKWLGVGVGGGALGICLILSIVFRICLAHDLVRPKKWRYLPYCIILIASVATGITISSLFVYGGIYPPIWQTALLYACFVALFFLYCPCTHLSFVRAHGNISLTLYAIILLTVSILLLVFFPRTIFLLASISLITLISFLISLPLDADDEEDHIQNLVFCSFGFLIVTILVVLIVISSGEGLDGLDFSGGGAGGPSKRKNPYDYLYKDWHE
ncbi:MAG: hypothetical protein K2M95_06160 [Clostridiales bacterium]|nr:hypothetical protein [Clostridiales bacterium]